MALARALDLYRTGGLVLPKAHYRTTVIQETNILSGYKRKFVDY